MDLSNHHVKKYIEYHDIYTKKYGENTVVLMQSGSHFNIFAVINDEVSLGPDIYHICQIVLNNALQVTKQNKKNPEISIKNCLLAGFPTYVIQKYENILLSNNYTVVIVEQITPPPNPERGVTRIISPGTTIDDYNKNTSHYLMSIYIECNEYMNKNVYISGLTVIDLSTGKNYMHYCISKIDDNQLWIDEIGKYINFYNPSEILFHFKNFSLTKTDIIQKWDIPHNSIQINHYDNKNFLKTTYQNEFLQNIFNLSLMMTPIEHFDLETKPEIVIAYIYMLNYINDHVAETLQNIEHPTYVNDEHCLCLTSNSIRQLNVVNNYSYFKGKNESLLSVCNLCVTPMGRRLFKERLLYPSVNIDVIQKRYDMIELYRKDNFYDNTIKILRKVSDLEKSLRKMGLKMLQPNDFFSDTLSYDYINQLLSLLKGNNDIYKKYDIIPIDMFQEFYQICKNTFIFHNLSQTGNLEKSIFQKYVNPDLDNYDDLTTYYYTILECIAIRFSKLLDGSENSVKLDFDERNEWFLYCTNKRATTFKEKVKNMNGKKIHVDTKIIDMNIPSFKEAEFTYKKKDASSIMIQTDYIKSISKKLIDVQDNIKKLNTKIWFEKTKELYDKYSRNLKQFYKILSEIDISSGSAKLSIQNGYYRPEIVLSDKSFIETECIRHPIVEKIHTDTEYVTNDIHLSKKNEKDGILLFGTNACGKSTFMKSIGLNLIMAQAGLFVAAKTFKYYPYTQIFTRILNNDNIFRSQSSFAVEIQELKSILKRANDKSLVLGDELCSGTESISAMSIIASGLNELCNRKTSFIFTSHLHQLTELDEIKSLTNLEIYHLKIDYDRNTNTLLYDRKLEKGSGPSIYGLKVCEAMGLSNDFISFAKKIQNKLENKETDTKLSQYNSNVYMDSCKVCNSKENLETHHIKDQQYSDDNKMIEHHHQNVKHNLVQLCKDCHLKVTHGKMIITGWKETSRGKKLDWKLLDKKINIKKKFNDEDIQKIKEIYKINEKLPKKDLIKIYELNHNIKISQSTLKKIIDNKY